jgi:hypothetical protein
MLHSRFFTQADVIDGDQLMSISGCARERIGDDERWVLMFRDSKKLLPLNATMLRVLAQAGADSDQWTGRKIIVFHDPHVTFRGVRTGGVRIRWPDREPPRPRGASAPSAPQATPSNDGADQFDDIPF